jgi:hypothetical protein
MASPTDREQPEASGQALVAITPDILRSIAKELLTGYAQQAVLSAAVALSTASPAPASAKPARQKHWTELQSEEAARVPMAERPYCWHCHRTKVWAGVWVCPDRAVLPSTEEQR